MNTFASIPKLPTAFSIEKDSSVGENLLEEPISDFLGIDTAPLGKRDIHISTISSGANSSFAKNRSKKYIDYTIDTISWIGFVERIYEDKFVGRLHEVGKMGLDEEAEFSRMDMTDDDEPLLRVGAVFYYSIGYVYRNGQRIKEAVLRFRRRINFTEDDVDEVEQNVADWIEGINWNE